MLWWGHSQLNEKAKKNTKNTPMETTQTVQQKVLKFKTNYYAALGNFNFSFTLINFLCK